MCFFAVAELPPPQYALQETRPQKNRPATKRGKFMTQRGETNRRAASWQSSKSSQAIPVTRSITRLHLIMCRHSGMARTSASG